MAIPNGIPSSSALNLQHKIQDIIHHNRKSCRISIHMLTTRYLVVGSEWAKYFRKVLYEDLSRVFGIYVSYSSC